MELSRAGALRWSVLPFFYPFLFYFWVRFQFVRVLKDMLTFPVYYGRLRWVAEGVQPTGPDLVSGIMRNFRLLGRHRISGSTGYWSWGRA